MGLQSDHKYLVYWSVAGKLHLHMNCEIFTLGRLEYMAVNETWLMETKETKVMEG